MSDTTDTPKPPDLAPRLDELLALIRTALAQDAGSDARSAGAIACRAILGTLDPTSRKDVPPASAAPTIPTSPAATSPIATLLGAIGQVPREQLLEVIGGLRWLLGQQGPAYRTRPVPAPTRPLDVPGGGS